MKSLIPTLIVLCVSQWAYADPVPISHGSTMPVPSLVSKWSAKSNQPMTARLPKQVGKIAGVLPGDFVAGFTSEIVLGNKRGSLCYETQPGSPSGTPTAGLTSFCKPILSTSYKDVTIRQVRVGNGNHGLLFTADPTSKASAATVKLAADSFMAGLERAQNSLTRHAAKPKTVHPTLVNGGGSCGYDDEDNTPTCEGGGGGGGGEGGGGGWDYPGAGGEWGGGGIGMDATSGNCIATPFGFLCTSTRTRPFDDPYYFPPIGGGAQEPRTAPWFPQSWCNRVHVLCSDTQEPEAVPPADNDRGNNSKAAGKSLSELCDICFAIYEVEMDVCIANKAGGTLRQCKEKAANRYSACLTTARRLTSNGAHTVEP